MAGASWGSKASRGIRSNVRNSFLTKNLLGLSQNVDERFLSPSEAIDIVNMHSLKDGSWSADKGGYVYLNETAYESGASIDGVYWQQYADGSEQLVFACNGKLKTVNLTTGIATDLDASATYHVGGSVSFQNVSGVLFSCDGFMNKPRKWDGTTASTYAGTITDGTNTYTKPKHLGLHQNRLILSNFNEHPDHYALSDINNVETFTTPATSASDSFIGEAKGGSIGIVGQKTIANANSNADVTILFKRRGIFAVTGASGLATDADAFKCIRLNNRFGSFNNNCIVENGQDLLAINEYGICSYTSATISGNVQPVGINHNRVRDVLSRINVNAVDKCWGIHLADRREIWWGIPTGASSQANEFIIYRYTDPGEQTSLPRWSRRKGFTASCGTLYGTSFYIGTYNGHIAKMFSASNYNGVGINWVYEYPFNDFGNELQYKNVNNAEAHFRVRGQQNFTIQTTWKTGDKQEVATKNLSIASTVTGSTRGGTKWGASKWGAKTESVVPFQISSDGGRLKLKLSGTTTSTGPEFLGAALTVEYGSMISN